MQKEIVSRQIVGWLTLGTLDLDMAHHRRDNPADLGRHAILGFKYVGEFAVKSFSPDLTAASGIQQLNCDTYAVIQLADAAAEDVTHPEF